MAHGISERLIPFAVALLLAYLINPIVDALDSRLKNRVAATLITVFGCLAVFIALIVIMVPLIGHELVEFGNVLTHFREDAAAKADGRTVAEKFDAFVAGQSNETIRQFLENAREALRNRDLQADLRALVLDAAKRIFPGLLNIVGGVVSFLLGIAGLIIVLLYTIFLLIDYSKVYGGWQNYLPPQHRDRITGFVSEFSGAMSGSSNR